MSVCLSFSNRRCVRLLYRPRSERLHPRTRTSAPPPLLHCDNETSQSRLSLSPLLRSDQHSSLSTAIVFLFAHNTYSLQLSYSLNPYKRTLVGLSSCPLIPLPDAIQQHHYFPLLTTTTNMSKVVRSVKNVTKGYSSVQVKVRNCMFVSINSHLVRYID